MHSYFINDLNIFGIGLGGLLFPLIIWDLAWKGWALWEAAQNKQSSWFIALLVLNTLGILPIIYIYLFSPRRNRKTQDGDSSES